MGVGSGVGSGVTVGSGVGVGVGVGEGVGSSVRFSVGVGVGSGVISAVGTDDGLMGLWGPSVAVLDASVGADILGLSAIIGSIEESLLGVKMQPTRKKQTAAVIQTFPGSLTLVRNRGQIKTAAARKNG